MTEETLAKIQVGNILITEFARLADDLDPYDDHYKSIVRRANLVRLRMKMYSTKHGEPPELNEQIDRMGLIIKKLEQKHNKHVTDM